MGRFVAVAVGCGAGRGVLVTVAVGVEVTVAVGVGRRRDVAVGLGRTVAAGCVGRGVTVGPFVPTRGSAVGVDVRRGRGVGVACRDGVAVARAAEVDWGRGVAVGRGVDVVPGAAAAGLLPEPPLKPVCAGGRPLSPPEGLVAAGSPGRSTGASARSAGSAPGPVACSSGDALLLGAVRASSAAAVRWSVSAAALVNPPLPSSTVRAAGPVWRGALSSVDGLLVKRTPAGSCGASVEPGSDVHLMDDPLSDGARSTANASLPGELSLPAPLSLDWSSSTSETGTGMVGSKISMPTSFSGPRRSSSSIAPGVSTGSVVPCSLMTGLMSGSVPEVMPRAATQMIANAATTPSALRRLRRARCWVCETAL